ncbi:MAG: hypothetical protein EPO16_10300 [Dehalococcoidia bacterium]|nr:MAG: hypothetical protein EPO16_10300 [Dehalococcoidia bacterium]
MDDASTGQDETQSSDANPDWARLRDALGGLVIAFGEMEAHLAATLSFYLGLDVDDGATVLTSRLGFRANVEIIDRLFEMSSDSRFKPIKGRLESAAQRRDQLIHSMWLPGFERRISGGYAIRAKWSRAGRLDEEEVLLDEIDQLVADIWSLHVDVEQLPYEFEGNSPYVGVDRVGRRALVGRRNADGQADIVELQTGPKFVPRMRRRRFKRRFP